MKKLPANLKDIFNIKKEALCEYNSFILYLIRVLFNNDRERTLTEYDIMSSTTFINLVNPELPVIELDDYQGVSSIQGFYYTLNFFKVFKLNHPAIKFTEYIWYDSISSDTMFVNESYNNLVNTRIPYFDPDYNGLDYVNIDRSEFNKLINKTHKLKLTLNKYKNLKLDNHVKNNIEAIICLLCIYCNELADDIEVSSFNEDRIIFNIAGYFSIIIFKYNLFKPSYIKIIGHYDVKKDIKNDKLNIYTLNDECITLFGFIKFITLVNYLYKMKKDVMDYIIKNKIDIDSLDTKNPNIINNTEFATIYKIILEKYINNYKKVVAKNKFKIDKNSYFYKRFIKIAEDISILITLDIISSIKK
ncbi:hypothetical protein [Campylobacter estrildidarum]|uniref:Uncharacterized protein n=1 Tax=Campylobacter estrildidarum TaxID=2510189 RepID=A0A4U7BLW6_9BACT|nr:hypothetical protein [Campylobacter estrildidarum]TKX31150.1 hypothetical protein CQA69_04225 [Campylobacter estrildidarum]